MIVSTRWPMVMFIIKAREKLQSSKQRMFIKQVGINFEQVDRFYANLIRINHTLVQKNVST